MRDKVLFQVSLLQGLTLGDYHGSVSVADIKKNGDTGLGTFNRLNGEMIILDGIVYRAAGDGSVEIVPDDETIPFGCATFMNVDDTVSLSGVGSIEELHGILNDHVKEYGVNRFYVIRIDGTFHEVNVRSIYAQNEPYKPMVEALAADQTFYDLKDVKGTVTGIYCPPFMASLNTAGWHMHFIDDARTCGGHLLGISIGKAEVSWDHISQYKLALPESEMFAGFDLAADLSEAVRKVETNR